MCIRDRLRIKCNEIPSFNPILGVRCPGDLRSEIGWAVLKRDESDTDPGIRDRRRILLCNVSYAADRLGTVDNGGSLEAEFPGTSTFPAGWRFLDPVAEHGDSIVEIPELGRIIRERV